MIVKLLLLLTITLKNSRCSLVIDSSHQKGLNLSEYCPNMKYCREGTHVMCMHYDPKNEIGPRCHNAATIKITADLANQLLDLANTIRSKIANGKETGKDSKLLPRGYGIFRLRWDNELATFAQVLANQCVVKHDLCRATKRFPSPSQTVSLIRFTFPDWQSLKTKEISPPSLTNAKLMQAINYSMKSWYAQKSSVTDSMVKVYPDWSGTENKGGRLYLDMIHGPATHMGCGISGYTEYVYYNGIRQGLHNVLQVVCNFSSGARKGTNTYETDPPIPDQGFTSKCGCPPGSDEDADCLCNEVKSPPRSRSEPTCPASEASGNCDPTLVLLPIFTMEDAPPDKLYQMAEEIKDPLKNFILQRIDNTNDTIESQGSFKQQRTRLSAEMVDPVHAKEEEDVWQRARNPSLVKSQAPSYNKIEGTSDTIDGQDSFKHGSAAEMFDFMHAKEGEDDLRQRARNPSSVQSQAPSHNKIERTSDTFDRQGSFKHELARSSPETFDFMHAREGEDVLMQRARNPSSVKSQASYNKIESTSDTNDRQGSFKHERARSSAEMGDFIHAKEGEDDSWQRARNPSLVQSQAPSYNKIESTRDTIDRQGSFKHERARSSPEMFDFMHAKEGEDGLSQRARNPSAVQSQAPSYNNLNREKQAAPDSKPPPPPPRKSPARRPSPPARPSPRTRPPPPPPRIPPPPPPAIDEYTSALKDHEETRPAPSKNGRSRPLTKLPPIHRLRAKKGSIFTKVAQFQLPKRKSMPSPLKVIRKDVAARKDFSNLSKVVHDYLKSRPGYKTFNDNHENSKPKEESKPFTEEKSQTEAVVTNTGLSSAEETVINFNQYLSQKNDSNEKEVDFKEDNDNKLLSLLDTLEREVKRIALDGSEKELFDAKIRKIYGSIVGKTALLKFPKPILLNTADIEAPEIEFGETKFNDRAELDHDENNHITVTEEPKQRSRYKVDLTQGRIKNYNPSIERYKLKTKFKDSFDQKKYKDNMDVISHVDRKPPSGGSYEHKYEENLDHEYGDIDQKHMDDLDRKYNENINKKYSENHLGHEYKFSDNFHHQHNYDLEQKYDDNEPAARSKIKYVANRDVFREFDHNSLDTPEDTIPSNYKYKEIKANHDTPDVPLITKDREKRKKTERKHRKRVKSLNTHNDHNDPLSLERRKYYQEKLDNIRKKLRSRRNRSKNDSKNERSLRRMHTKNRQNSRSKSKSPADNFYMPERARFLHGF